MIPGRHWVLHSSTPNEGGFNLAIFFFKMGEKNDEIDERTLLIKYTFDFLRLS